MTSPLRAFFVRRSAKALIDAQRWGDAAARYEVLRNLGAMRPSDGVQHAKTTEALGRTEFTAQLHQENARAFPLAPNVHRQMGLFLLRTGREPDAAMAFAKAAVLAPSDAVLKSDLARLGVNEDAIRAIAAAGFFAASQPTPPKPDVLSRFRARRAAKIAKTLRQAGDWRRALDAQSKVTTNNPNNASGQIRLGHVLKELGRGDEAEVAYWKGVALAPREADNYLQLAHGLKAQRGLRGGLPAYLLAQKLRPDHVAAGMAVRESGLSEHDLSRFTDALAHGDVAAILAVVSSSTDPAQTAPDRGVSASRRPTSKIIEMRAAAIAGDIALSVGVTI